VAALPAIGRGAKVTAVISSHHVRYVLLPWSVNLAGEREWEALARHRFAETFGTAVNEWEVRVSPEPKGAPRVAIAVDRGQLAELRAAVKAARAKLVSVQPALMHAFNAKRRALRSGPAWLVAPEPGRLTLALVARGLWELVRVRNVGENWRDELEAILRREEELARRESPVEKVVLA
jgi:hypothetical protein